MKFDMVFEEQDQSFQFEFGEIQNVSYGGYDRGYAEGYEKGEEDGILKGYADGQETGYAEGCADGLAKGYAEGLAARTYETWTITLVDGSVVEKEVALL